MVIGIFYKRRNKEGAIVGMISGLVIISAYIINFKFINVQLNASENWFLGVSPEGFEFIGMLLNFCIAIAVSFFHARPPENVSLMVDQIREP